MDNRDIEAINQRGKIMAECKICDNDTLYCNYCNKDGTAPVSVPFSELESLEDARSNLYEYLSDKLTHDQLNYELPHITKQIWRVANTKKWS